LKFVQTGITVPDSSAKEKQVHNNSFWKPLNKIFF